MSRGPGRMQRLVIAELSHEPIGWNELLWRLAKEEPGAISVQGELVPGVRLGKIRPPFYKAFDRAVLSLAKARRLDVEKRKLRTADELVRHYPFKTLRLEARDLRSALLPVVVTIASQRHRVKASSEIEDHLLHQKRQEDPSYGASWLEQWLPIRASIGAVLATSAAGAQYDLLLQLLARGQHFFDHTSTVTSIAVHQRNGNMRPTSLLHLIQLTEQTLPVSTVAALKALYRRAIPRDRHEQRLLKDLLFRVGEFRRDKAPGLSQTTKEELLKLAPEIVRDLPGYTPAVPQRSFLDRERRAGFGPHLNLVLDRHALDPFTFLTAA